ncbi:MAG: BTAD domain-containing putative transcriptional regulator [Thermoanaerobaculaceae bacterium]
MTYHGGRGRWATARRVGTEREAGQVEAPGIRVTLLGGFALSSPAGPHRLESAKTEVLLAYLALAPGSHARAKLQGLLWPDLPEERAARNLRHALWDIRHTFAAAGAAVLAADRTRVTFEPHPDVLVDARELTELHEALRGGRQPAPRLAVDALVLAELLEGVFLGDAPELEQWLLAERERLRAVACDVLRTLIAVHRQQGDLASALGRARTLVELDPWREESHRTVMELLTLAGEPAGALAQFEACRQVLAEQLQTTPTADTVRLAERIRAFSGGVAGAADPPLIRHNLPAQATPFVGRESEIEAVERLLLAPECRLVCLLGPGGIGKSRLALQVGQRQVLGGCTGRAFADGIWFVPSQEGGEAGGLAAAVARALALGESPGLGAPALEGRLGEYLRHRRVLLMLDGFEHLLPDAGALAALIAAAPPRQGARDHPRAPRPAGRVGRRGCRTGAAGR